MAFCWEKRGCDEEMQSRCPHNLGGELCPADCFFAACERETHIIEKDLDVLLNPDLDYEAAAKQICRYCSFFLTHGPQISDSSSFENRVGNPNRFLL